jgi:hypothetical protein
VAKGHPAEDVQALVTALGKFKELGVGPTPPMGPPVEIKRSKAARSKKAAKKKKAKKQKSRKAKKSR